jgi:D-alanyl-lipoteichoic acid acyltransferase DltB (MBOAT superfamily)
MFLAITLGTDLTLLFYFKYLLFFADNATGLLRFLGFDVETPSFNIILPLGISFYTFHTMSYTIDVYRGLIRPERNYVLFACYVTFFPQLVAGPILRAREVIPQLDARPRFALDDLAVGIRRLLFGLFLKVVLADNLAPAVDAGFALTAANLSAIDVWTLAFVFGFQIYFDFSGYSHIALGCARMMGVKFPENFDYPYLATSPGEFWRRWHISLLSWIRDYLYLPLVFIQPRGASSKGGLTATAGARGRQRHTRAVLITWLVMGLWHGASWTFVLWGLYHAALVLLDLRLTPKLRRIRAIPSRLRTIGGWAITVPPLMLGFIAFRAQTISEALQMYAKLLDPRQYLDLGLNENAYLVAALVLLGMLFTYWFEQVVVPILESYRAPWVALQGVAYSVCIALVFVFLRPINQFIYFQF